MDVEGNGFVMKNKFPFWQCQTDNDSPMEIEDFITIVQIFPNIEKDSQEISFNFGTMLILL